MLIHCATLSTATLNHTISSSCLTHYFKPNLNPSYYKIKNITIMHHYISYFQKCGHDTVVGEISQYRERGAASMTAGTLAQ